MDRVSKKDNLNLEEAQSCSAVIQMIRVTLNQYDAEYAKSNIARLWKMIPALYRDAEALSMEGRDNDALFVKTVLRSCIDLEIEIELMEEK